MLSGFAASRLIADFRQRHLSAAIGAAVYHLAQYHCRRRPAGHRAWLSNNASTPRLDAKPGKRCRHRARRPRASPMSAAGEAPPLKMLAGRKSPALAARVAASSLFSIARPLYLRPCRLRHDCAEMIRGRFRRIGRCQDEGYNPCRVSRPPCFAMSQAAESTIHAQEAESFHAASGCHRQALTRASSGEHLRHGPPVMTSNTMRQPDHDIGRQGDAAVVGGGAVPAAYEPLRHDLMIN